VTLPERDALAGQTYDSLQELLEATLSRLGCSKVNLQVTGSNAAVVPFYQRLGYLVEDRVSMGKLLTATSGRVLPNLDTERLTLRPIALADLGAYHALMSDVSTATLIKRRAHTSLRE
jgi:RimJ/RimL family protein N-acetyltransferase